MSYTPDLSQEVARATFTPLPPAPGEAITVHFNPASLQYTVANTLKNESGGDKKQYIDETSAKLSMQLVFDTTDTGEDVRAHTDRVAALLKPMAEDGKQVPPNVEFGWGLYRFTGLVEQYKETLDFFAISGVPLRASIDITLASQDVQFDSARNPPASVDRELAPEPAVVPAGQDGPAGLANALGDPRAARAIASANGSPSLRFGAGASAGLAVGAGVQLKTEAAFSTGLSLSAGAGLGVGAGLGFGAGAGAGAGFGFGVGGDAGLGFGVSADTSLGFGASASAAANFGGLRSSVQPQLPVPSGRALFETANASLTLGAGAKFGVGGAAQTHTSSSLGADVGVDGDLHALIKFG